MSDEDDIKTARKILENPDGNLPRLVITPAGEFRPRCDRCGSGDLYKVHGCIRCRACGYKFDCNGF